MQNMEGYSAQPETAPAQSAAVSPEAYLGEVVIDLIEASETGRASAKEIVYALTLEETVTDDLFTDIISEVQVLETAGRIARTGSGKYESTSENAGLKSASSDGAATPAAQPRSRRSRRKGPSAKDKDALEQKMSEAFGGSFTKPVQGRKRRENKRPPRRARLDPERRVL